MQAKNLCLLPQADQQAIEEDKQRWFECWKMIRDWPRHRIKNWLDNQCNPELKEDYRRRLNAIEKTNNN